MRIRALLLIAGLAALAACGEPLGKKPMLAGCEAAVLALRPELRQAPLDHRAVVGREAILRFQLADGKGDPHAVNVKCKVGGGGKLKRVKVDGERARGGDFEAASRAFAAAIGK